MVSVEIILKIVAVEDQYKICKLKSDFHFPKKLFYLLQWKPF